MKSVQKGFTLIELMIVVAIIAILAAIAIPQYQTYVIRSQVTRAIGETSDQKALVEDCINNNLATVASGAGNCDPTATASDILTGPVQGSEVLPNGVTAAGFPQVTLSGGGVAQIQSTLGNHASQAVAGATVTLNRDANGNWVCAFSGSAKYAPASCPGT